MKRIEIITADPRQEERAARAAQRELDRRSRERERASERRLREKLRGIVAEELATARGQRCRCGLRQVRSRRELTELGGGCTAGLWVCPVLDAVRRRLDR